MFLRRIFISRKQLTCKEKREEESNFKTRYYYYISHVAETLFERGKLFFIITALYIYVCRLECFWMCLASLNTTFDTESLLFLEIKSGSCSTEFKLVLKYEWLCLHHVL